MRPCAAAAGRSGPLGCPRAPPVAGSLGGGLPRVGGNSSSLAGPERFPGRGPAGMGLNLAPVGPRRAESRRNPETGVG